MKSKDGGKELKKRVTSTTRVAKSPQPKMQLTKTITKMTPKPIGPISGSKINPVQNTLRRVNDSLAKAKEKLPYKRSVNPIKKALIDRSNSKFTSSKADVPGYGSVTKINGKSAEEKNIDKNYKKYVATKELKKSVNVITYTDPKRLDKLNSRIKIRKSK